MRDIAGNDTGLADRFVVQRRLGSGAMGTVYQVFDRERNAVVALKTLNHLDAERIYRFKNEFRSLAGLAHPNLVKLYELLSGEDSWFFTMERISGEDFRAWVRPSAEPDEEHETAAQDFAELVTAETAPARSFQRGALDPERLRGAVRQLASGVAALHQAGKLHRDIKPSNILVTPAGRVVLCDFGLVTETRTGGRAADDGTEILGTPAYMAPEQACGAAVGEASDWFSVGVVLYEALTGYLPFLGGPWALVGPGTLPEPVPPSRIEPATPPDLEALCLQLLRAAPGERPRGAEILAQLGVEASADLDRPALLAADGERFLGRSPQLARLAEALETSGSRPVVALVKGASGMGKTALVRQFLGQVVGTEQALVLEGRCYEQESMPYKALDTVIDALTRHLLRLPDERLEEVLPRETPALARLFPVLRRIEAVVAPRIPILAPPDPIESRRRAVQALRDLLGRLARRRQVIVSIDDVQWGDLDSGSLLADVLRPPGGPHLLLLVSCRSEDVATSPFLRECLAGGPDVVDVAVEPLSTDEAGRLVRALLDGGGGEAAFAQDILRDAAGNPFLLTELGRYARDRGAGQRPGQRVTMADVIERRLRELGGAERRLLEAVCVAGRPVRHAVLRRAAGLGDDPEAPTVVLRSKHLIRSRGFRADDLVEAYHDRIRETVVAGLSPERLRTWHQRMAQALEAFDGDREALAMHFFAAGEPERAARYALVAAEQAAEALAFDRAARLYSLAIEARPPQGREASRLHGRLGDALSHTGRAVEAAEAFLRAAEGTYVAEMLEFRRRAAEQYLRCGHIDAGLETLREVMTALHMKLPAGPREKLARLLWARLRVRLRGLRYRERDLSQISAEELQRVDTCFSIHAGLGLVDSLTAVTFQAEHLVRSLDAGDVLRISRALSIEAMYLSITDERGRRRSRDLTERALELAARCGDPRAQVWGVMSKGLCAYQSGTFSECIRHNELALEVLRNRCTGAEWETDTAALMRLWSLYYTGELGQLQQAVPALIQAARFQGDLFAETGVATGLPNAAWLTRGDLSGARRVCDEAIQRWTHVGFHLQHYWHWFAHRQIDLYSGEPDQAYDALALVWPALRRALLLRIQAVRCEALEVRGRITLARAARDPARRPALLRAAEADARRLAREPGAWSRALSVLLAAGAAAVRGDEERAAALYADAEARLRSCDMFVHAAAAQRRRGELVGGDEGQAAVAEAEAWMRGKDIVDPARWSAVLAPR